MGTAIAKRSGQSDTGTRRATHPTPAFGGPAVEPGRGEVRVGGKSREAAVDDGLGFPWCGSPTGAPSCFARPGALGRVPQRVNRASHGRPRRGRHDHRTVPAPAVYHERRRAAHIADHPGLSSQYERSAATWARAAAHRRSKRRRCTALGSARRHGLSAVGARRSARPSQRRASSHWSGRTLVGRGR
jgi:hypothetical protein